MRINNAQNMTESDLKKKFFPAENARNVPEKLVFWHFLEILSLVFSDFCTKMHINNDQNMTESDF